MRHKLKDYFTNLIDDVKDEDVRNKLLDRLEAIDDEIFELDYDIRYEVEKQGSDYIDNNILADEFNYSCRMPA